MPTWLEIVLIVLGAAILLLALGGGLAVARRDRRLGETFVVDVQRANHALAEAHAGDKGWEPEALHAAARAAFEGERPGSEIRELALVQVVDLPGVDQDEAVFVVASADEQARVTLGRSEGRWELKGFQAPIS